MRQEHAELAGEMSGHMFFADRYYGYDDASTPHAALSRSLRNRASLSLTSLRAFRSLSPRRNCASIARMTRNSKWSRRLRTLRQHRAIVDVDGVRVPFEHGWGLVRASNTQPVLVMRFEATDNDWLNRYKDEMEKAVEQAKEK